MIIDPPFCSPTLEIAFSDAAATDPEMAAQGRTNEAERVTAFRALVQQLEDRSPMRVPTEEAVDIVYALQSPDLYAIVTGRGWTGQQWEEFVVGLPQPRAHGWSR